MPADKPVVWLAAGVRTPFAGVDGPFAHRDSLSLSVPVVQAMAAQVTGSIDFAVWGAVVVNLAYGNLAREVWHESKLDPHVPTFTTIMQCSTSMVGVFEAAGMMERSDRGWTNWYGGDAALSGPLDAAWPRRAGARQDCAQRTRRRGAAGEHHRQRV